MGTNSYSKAQQSLAVSHIDPPRSGAQRGERIFLLVNDNLSFLPLIELILLLILMDIF